MADTGVAVQSLKDRVLSAKNSNELEQIVKDAKSDSLVELWRLAFSLLFGTDDLKADKEKAVTVFNLLLSTHDFNVFEKEIQTATPKQQWELGFSLLEIETLKSKTMGFMKQLLHANSVDAFVDEIKATNKKELWKFGLNILESDAKVDKDLGICFLKSVLSASEDLTVFKDEFKTALTQNPKELWQLCLSFLLGIGVKVDKNKARVIISEFGNGTDIASKLEEDKIHNISIGLLLKHMIDKLDDVFKGNSLVLNGLSLYFVSTHHICCLHFFFLYSKR